MRVLRLLLWCAVAAHADRAAQVSTDGTVRYLQGPKKDDKGPKPPPPDKTPVIGKGPGKGPLPDKSSPPPKQDKNPPPPPNDKSPPPPPDKTPPDKGPPTDKNPPSDKDPPHDKDPKSDKDPTDKNPPSAKDPLSDKDKSPPPDKGPLSDKDKGPSDKDPLSDKDKGPPSPKTRNSCPAFQQGSGIDSSNCGAHACPCARALWTVDVQAHRAGQYVSTGNDNTGNNNAGTNTGDGTTGGDNTSNNNAGNNNTGGDNTGGGDNGDPTMVLQPESAEESLTNNEGVNVQNVAELGRSRRELQTVTPMTWHGG